MLLPFDDRQSRSGLDCVVDDIGISEALEPYRDVIDKLFDKFKDEQYNSYVTLAFSFLSYRDCCDEWDYDIRIIGRFDFNAGRIVEIEN